LHVDISRLFKFKPSQPELHLARVSLRHPSFASGSQEIEDFLGVSLQSETARGPFRYATLCKAIQKLFKSYSKAIQKLFIVDNVIGKLFI